MQQICDLFQCTLIFFVFVFNFSRTHVKSDEGLNTTHASIHVLVLDTKIVQFKFNFTAIKLSN